MVLMQQENWRPRMFLQRGEPKAKSTPVGAGFAGGCAEHGSGKPPRDTQF